MRFRSAIATARFAACWPTTYLSSSLTISFGVGQTLGPILVGAITDALGSLSYALNVSAAMLALGAVASACQRKVGPA